MSLFTKLKTLFSGAPETPEAQTAAPVPEQEDEMQPEATAQADEIELLDRLAGYQIVDKQTMTRSCLEMTIYRFAAPFDGADMRTLIRGMRWLGFRVYGFGVRVAGADHECESWQEFMRLLSEAEPDGCSLFTSFCGVRVNCIFSAEGVLHLSHDSSRGVDFGPFDELFNPEELPEEADSEAKKRLTVKSQEV